MVFELATTQNPGEIEIPEKRSRGRTKGVKGPASFVQCGQCGQLIPRDKAKKVSRRISLVDSRLAKELKSKAQLFHHVDVFDITVYPVPSIEASLKSDR